MKPRVLISEQNIGTAALMVKFFEARGYPVELILGVRDVKRAAKVAIEAGEQSPVIVMEAGRTDAAADREGAVSIDHYIEREGLILENPGRVVLLWHGQSRVERAMGYGPVRSVGKQAEVWMITKPFLMDELQEIVEIIADGAWDAGRHSWRKPVVWESPVGV